MVEKTKVKILAISGSGRKANTYYAVKQALQAAEEFDFVEKTEFISLADFDLKPCRGCMRCFGWVAPPDDEVPWHCWLTNDDSHILIRKTCEYDGLILGAPVYRLHVNALTSIFWEKRSSFVGLQWGVGAGKERIKVFGYILVGGAQDATQEWAAHNMIQEGRGWPVGVPLPMLDDTLPLRGNVAALVTTGESVNVYNKQGYTVKESRVTPPLVSERNEKTVRAVGRSVAINTLLAVAGERLVKELDIKIPTGPVWKKWNIKPKPGSMMDKRAKEGLIELIDPSTPIYEEFKG